MYCKIISGAPRGVEAYPVGVEVDVANGLPMFNMVGSINSEVRESRERVSVALKNAGLNIPVAHVTVNFSPADVRKEGTGFDLAIAVGLLVNMNYFEGKSTDGILFMGELGLNGEIRPVRGVLPVARMAAGIGIRKCIVPKQNMMEGAVVPDICVMGAAHIAEVIRYLKDPEGEGAALEVAEANLEELFEREEGYEEDFMRIAGQERAKRAAKIAAAGFHNLLLSGPPGAGKSMIARCIPGILPPLSLEESLEVTSVRSVAGLLGEGEALVKKRPFQNPHHTVTMAALTGGGIVPRPGIMSLAHRGVLFMDELPEFGRGIIDSMRQPLEDKQIHIARVQGNIVYPADFMLVCAMNPCPCGFYPDRNRCHCTETSIRRYMGKVSGPVLDRIDLCVELERVNVEYLSTFGRKSNLEEYKSMEIDRKWDEGLQKKSGLESQMKNDMKEDINVAMEKIEREDSRSIREQVMKARELQKKRFEGTDYRFNSDIKPRDMERFCPLGEEEAACMKEVYGQLILSARTYHRILKVARTIADLSGEEDIRKEHLLEAASFRPSLEYWG